ncbi:Predicted arabinose efflux permease, MFS family [Streptosporangium subroseum]|uniref:Predicted arabinose efflux permease, MFS family n=1 Tax=Streptosporangium subroseum TaxID=106412 RepID=A0A239FFF3_9ACTN|nr:MFS transporter [Streptosporangium subroseum]SNS55248.1 Predicted arabinose efflux permease, MFS family [Streptosporangium subroseum]
MSTSSGRMDGRAWGVLLVLCGAIFLEGIDVAMLNVALPSIRADLGLSTGMLSGVVSAYVLGYGGFMLLGGRTADLLGRRRMFLFWLTVFLVFSGLGGFATEGWMLLVARFATGVAAAFMAPAGLSLITGNFPEGPQRTRALGVYAGTAAGGFSLGLVAGGLLASFGWRWVFFAPVILSAVILLAAIPLLKDSRAPERPAGGFDLAGAFGITGAMLLLVYGVVRLEHPGNGRAGTVGTFAAGLALLAAFVVIERRAANPLVRLGILRSGPLVRANLGALLFLSSFAGFQFLVTLYLQELRGWSTLQTGLAMLVIGVDTVLAPTLTPRLVNRFGNVPVLFGGMVLATLAYVLFLPVGLDWAYTAMLPTMILLGLAFSLAYGPLTMAAVDGVDEHEHGLAGGLLYTAMQFGTALGLSAVTAVNVAALGDGGSPEAGLNALQAALVVPVVAGVLGAVVTAFGLRARKAPRIPEPVPAETVTVTG